MKQPKRHHFVPKAYLNAFCDQQGRILVYRKDAPQKPLHQTPGATQFRSYYYSQPTPDGGQDNNTLEQFFSTIESKWPDTIARLHRREDVNDRLEDIFAFMSLQRVRVPAARDAIEASMAQSVRDTLTLMHANGELPPMPSSLKGDFDQVEVSIDPHKSIHAMPFMMRAMAPLYSAIGLVAVHNKTVRPFLTSDNPVLWFNPTLPFDEQRPYTLDPAGGRALLVFPVSPKLALIGATEYKDSYKVRGLQHTDVTDEKFVEMINAQVSRFAYEAVIAQSSGQEELISEFADVSPVFKAVAVPGAQGILTIHTHEFGPRTAKPKWRGK